MLNKDVLINNESVLFATKEIKKQASKRRSIAILLQTINLPFIAAPPLLIASLPISLFLGHKQLKKKKYISEFLDDSDLAVAYLLAQRKNVTEQDVNALASFQSLVSHANPFITLAMYMHGKQKKEYSDFLNRFTALGLDLEFDDESEISSIPNRISNNYYTKIGQIDRTIKDKDIYLFNYKLSEVSKIILYSVRIKNNENIKNIKTITEQQEPPVYASNVDLAKSTLVIGKMGSGKSVLLKNLLAQEQYSRAILNDVKGEYVEAFYDEEKGDIIFQPYDARGKLWFFFEDIKREPTLADIIASAMVSQISESNKDFWITAGTKLLKDAIIFASFSDHPNKHNAILEYIQLYQNQATQINDKTALSVVSTLQPILDYFELASFLESKYIREEQYHKFFTLHDFIFNTNKQKLFLLNDATHRQATAPFQTAFLSALISMLLSRPDTTTDFTFFLLDEFLSLKIPEDLLIPLFTTSRSKGIQLLFATQFLPNISNDKRAQIILSSRQLTIIFKTVDEQTLATIENTMGEMEFITQATNTQISTSASSSHQSSKSQSAQRKFIFFTNHSHSNSTSKSDSTNVSYSENTQMQRATKKLIDRSYILALPEYHALIHQADPFQLFLGKVEKFYFDFAQKKANAFEKLDLSEFYRSKVQSPQPQPQSQPQPQQPSPINNIYKIY